MWSPRTDFDVMARIMSRTEIDVNGALDISYVPAEKPFFCSFKGFHGSESLRAGSIGVTDGGTITTWYDSSFDFKNRIIINDDAGLVYDVISIENFEMKNEFSILKVSRVVNA